MKQLQALAQHAAQKRIRGRSYKRNSLLKPLDIILDELERCPDYKNKNELEFSRASSKGLVYEHVRRVHRGVPEEDIYQYITLFFDGVLNEAHQDNVNKLLQRERSIRSAYLVYLREEVAQIFLKRGQAKNISEAMLEIDKVEEQDDEAEEQQ